MQTFRMRQVGLSATAGLSCYKIKGKEGISKKQNGGLT